MPGSARCRETADRHARAQHGRLISSRAGATEHCPAWRLRRGAGARLNSGAEIIETGEGLKNDNCPPPTSPENGQRICAGACGSLPRRDLYSIGRLRGLGPRGKALSRAAISSPPSTRSPAAALSAACSWLEAFGMANTEGSRVRKLRATWRGEASCAVAIACSTSPALLCRCGNSL